ncbi:MAG TPA: VapE domain-containing protein [Polyangiaceae bacterium]|nr:VapE domain-containing protein [Polyangiaceae bacterium]
MTTETKAPNARLLSASAYAKRGWAVFPCRPRTKEPATTHGFKDATADKALITRWWKKAPFANVAIATGQVSKLAVVDIDPRNLGDLSLRELERKYGPLPETLRAVTGGSGAHIYLDLKTDEPLRSGKLADGIDFKADGGYVIAPPSVHPSGQPYRWELDPNRTRIAPCPAWILRRMRGGSNNDKPTDASAPNAGDAATSALGCTLAQLGMLGRLLEGGKRAVICPWQDQHTTGVPFDSSTVLFPATEPNGLGGFHCSHSHCEKRTSAEAMRALERKRSGASEDASWLQGLRRTGKGAICSTFGNLVRILSNDPAYVEKLRLDEMRNVAFLEKSEVTDAHLSTMRVDIEDRYAIQPNEAETARAAQLVAARNSFHPVREFLSGLTWDGTPRLDGVAREILRVRAETDEEVEIATLIVRRWFLCLVARPFEPGCKVDNALILQGPQGAGKSTFFRVLGGEWFSDTEMALDKDALMQLRGAWIYEWAELENVTGRHAMSRVKAFVTSPEDKFRPPFARMPITVRRSGVIVGTTNSDDFLHDPTGHRRFWIVPVGRIDVERLRAEREQLLGEAVVAHRADERWWLDDDEEERRKSIAARFVDSDPWEERVLEYARQQEAVRTSDVLMQALDVTIDRLTRHDEMRVANILRRAGYESRRARSGAWRGRLWCLRGK